MKDKNTEREREREQETSTKVEASEMLDCFFHQDQKIMHAMGICKGYKVILILVQGLCGNEEWKNFLLGRKLNFCHGRYACTFFLQYFHARIHYYLLQFFILVLLFFLETIEKSLDSELCFHTFFTMEAFTNDIL